MDAVRYFLLKYKEDIHPRFNIPFILESIDFILKNNTCVFDNEYFLQLQGTAMGTVFAPTYANLSMGYHEIKLYDLIELNYSVDIRQYFVENWKRFLDDCQILLKTDLIKPDDLLTILNSVNNNIQFSMELNDNKLPFLDILITKSGKKIWMNIYSKPTDSKRYVPYLSNHPKPCLKNIPFCLARRICTIVENKNVRYMKLKELKTILKTQKYPKMVVEKGIEKALVIPQKQLRSEKLKKKDDILPFISTFNPNNQNVFPKVREIYRNLQTSKTLGKIFAKHKLIDCKRQPSNLKRLSCSSNFSTNKPTFKTTKCGKSCFCCDYIIEAELFKFKNWHQPFVLKFNFYCETPNLIYVIICSGCNKKYIEQTGGQLKERLSIYRQHI